MKATRIKIADANFCDCDEDNNCGCSYPNNTGKASCQYANRYAESCRRDEHHYDVCSCDDQGDCDCDDDQD